MTIEAEDNRGSLRRRWGVPLGVATGVAAMSVGAVAVFGGAGDAAPRLASPASSGGTPFHCCEPPMNWPTSWMPEKFWIAPQATRISA
ncbi:hypothetical protein ACWD3D_30775, partial [Streptomyces sp. NPDC002690]